MRTVVAILCLLFPLCATAQTNQVAQVPQELNMQGVDMQKMMQVMQQVQKCMEKIDKAEMEKLEQESETMNQEIKQLCAEGKRDKAQKTAIKYAKEIKKNTAMQQMIECGELTKDVMPDDGPDFFEDFDGSQGHVCDADLDEDME